MRTLLLLSFLSLSACVAAPGSNDSASDSNGSASEAFALSPDHVEAHQRAGDCAHPPSAIFNAFDAFDAHTSPPPLGQPATVVLAAWLGYLAPNVVFVAGNAAPLVGPTAVASYFAPLLPAIGTVVHQIDTISPVCGLPDAWSVRGTLLVTRRSDGQAIEPIPFTDTIFFDENGLIERYEIRFDPTPLNDLFAS
jgi:hypothetical protein